MRSVIDISPEFYDLYQLHTQIGQDFIKDKTIACVGLARDIGDQLLNSVDKVLSLQSHVNKLDIVVIENDSTDNTKSVLSELKHKHDNFTYISQDYGLPKFGQVKDKERTQALSDQRNKYISYLNDKDYDYTIVLDFDFLDFSKNGIFNSFGWLSESNIDAMCGISLRNQHVLSSNYKNYWNYDCWAFRQNWWHDTQSYINDCNPMLWFGFWIPPIGSPPIRVNSGFGGMCIYQTDQLIQSKYEGYDCEHVCLHRNLYNQNESFNLSMNPSQLMFLI